MENIWLLPVKVLLLILCVFFKKTRERKILVITQCATESALAVHRFQALGTAMNVSWHPFKYVFAYCGQSKPRENAPSVAFFSTFGPGV